MPRRVSIKDIALDCSLSVMTVSRALRNAYGIHPKTREKILESAKRMGYVPNRLATNLVLRKTETVGVILPDISHSIFPGLYKSLEMELSRRGYRLFLCCSYDQPEKEMQEAMALLERRVDGIILAPASLARSAETVERIKAQNCALVLVDRMIPGVDADAVTVTDFEGARGIVSHLVERGYARIAHFAGPEDVWTAAERRRGYEEALRAAHKEIRPELVVPAGLTVDDGEAAMERLLEWSVLPGAIFCVNDPVALGAYKALKRRGVRVPGGVALAGFSDVLEAELLEVPLTSVRQDAEQLGNEAARLLLSRMTDKSFSGKTDVLSIPTELVFRESTLGK